ncbi:MAG TPA: hypothetical protein G4O10_02020 [Dehalococcoidia bacterium]|nr:hypothetical protein [Dehalococcoidia bacterium]
MKAKTLTIVVVLAILACSITTCTPNDSYLVQVMKLAPEDTNVVLCIDAEAIAEDPDFGYIYDATVSSLGHETANIDRSAISTLASISTDSYYVLVFVGDFGLKDVRGTLIEEDYVEGEYLGVEIWTGDFEHTVAFIDNMIVSSYTTDSVKACIRIHKNEEPSMYDNEDMKSVVDKLPASVVSVVFGPDYMSDIEILAGGICVQNQNREDEVLDYTGWYRFDSEVSAEDAMEDFEDYMRIELDAISINAHLSGQFIEIAAEVELPEY